MLFYSITKRQVIIIDYYKSLDIVFYDHIMSNIHYCSGRLAYNSTEVINGWLSAEYRRPLIHL